MSQNDVLINVILLVVLCDLGPLRGLLVPLGFEIVLSLKTIGCWRKVDCRELFFD